LGRGPVRRASLCTAAYPHWTALRLDRVTRAAQQFIIEVSSTRRSARCPACLRRSHRAPRPFTSVLAALSLEDFPVDLGLHARLFHCGTPCPLSRAAAVYCGTVRQARTLAGSQRRGLRPAGR